MANKQSVKDFLHLPIEQVPPNMKGPVMAHHAKLAIKAGGGSRDQVDITTEMARRAIGAVFTEQRIRVLAKVAYRQAKNDGNFQAFLKLFEYVAGRPAVEQTINVNSRHKTTEEKLLRVRASMGVAQTPDVPREFIDAGTGSTGGSTEAVPALPVEVHQRPEPLCGGEQGGSDGHNVVPLVEVSHQTGDAASEAQP